MPEAEQLSDLIGAIYDASLNPELWLPVLEQTSRFINSATATIGSRDMLQKHTSFSKAWGYDPHYLQLLESHYGLRVLLAVVEVGGIPEIAPMLGISEATAKTHLKHVFEKTGVNRQADLVKVVAGFMNPLG
jgi:hypothetical protein